jgi:hypothetical protein
VVRFVDAGVHAAAHVFHERTEQAPVDVGQDEARIEDQ